MNNGVIFLDIDGCLIDMREDFVENLRKDEPNPVIKGSARKVFDWHCKGYKIIITTARPESSRDYTVRELKYHGIVYDILLMGIGSGPRYLINDKERDGSDKAFSINVIRNNGISDIILSE